MTDAAQVPDSECVVLLPPTRRDAEVTRRLLADARIECEVQADVQALARRVRDGVGAVMLTDFTLARDDLRPLADALGEQPPWSSVPVLALCPAAGQPVFQSTLLHAWPNVTVLDRPTSSQAMLSAVRAGLRGRRSQYQLRDRLRDLMRVEEALRQADRRKDEFLAVLAHELRNPLAPIRTGVALLARPEVGAAEAGRVRAIVERQLQLMVKLIDELLDVARIATGKIVLKRERVDLRTVVGVALDGARPLLDAAAHRLDSAIAETPIPVDGDPDRLAQAIGNLVANAAKYTPRGGRVRVEARAAGGLAEVVVADNGLGIPDSMIERVFDLFAQVNATLERAQGGLGIGLSLVRSLAGLHGGSVEARSAGPGRGSTFTLRLPLAAAGSAAGDGDVDARCGGTADRRALRVLVVDDNVDAADSLAMLVESLGHEARTAYGGHDGLRAVDAFAPDVVFCDLGMPGCGGHEVARRLHGRDGRGAMTLVALTGWGSDDDRSRARAAGFDRHLVKPATVDGVRDVLVAAGIAH